MLLCDRLMIEAGQLRDSPAPLSCRIAIYTAPSASVSSVSSISFSVWMVSKCNEHGFYTVVKVIGFNTYFIQV